MPVGAGLRTAMKKQGYMPLGGWEAGVQVNYPWHAEVIGWCEETNHYRRFIALYPGGEILYEDVGMPYIEGEDAPSPIVVPPVEPPPSVPPVTGDMLIAAARKYEGIPYKMGKLDCSQLWVNTLTDLGIHNGEDMTAEMIRQKCIPVSWDEVRRGDFLFFEKTYDHTERTTHVGVTMGPGTKKMYDTNDTRGFPGETDIGTEYWQEHIFAAGRWPGVGELPGGGKLPNDEERQFSFGELYPHVQEYCRQYGFDSQVMMAIILQESSYINHRVHDDGTGHGLMGFDDGGLWPEFEGWFKEGPLGRGHNARAVPMLPQLEFGAMALARYLRAYGDPYACARAWHRGGGAMDDSRGWNYEKIIRGLVQQLFGGG